MDEPAGTTQEPRSYNINDAVPNLMEKLRLPLLGASYVPLDFPDKDFQYMVDEVLMRVAAAEYSKYISLACRSKILSLCSTCPSCQRRKIVARHTESTFSNTKEKACPTSRSYPAETPSPSNTSVPATIYIVSECTAALEKFCVSGSTSQQPTRKPTVTPAPVHESNSTTPATASLTSTIDNLSLNNNLSAPCPLRDFTSHRPITTTERIQQRLDALRTTCKALWRANHDRKNILIHLYLEAYHAGADAAQLARDVACAEEGVRVLEYHDIMTSTMAELLGTKTRELHVASAAVETLSAGIKVLEALGRGLVERVQARETSIMEILNGASAWVDSFPNPPFANEKVRAARSDVLETLLRYGSHGATTTTTTTTTAVESEGYDGDLVASMAAYAARLGVSDPVVLRDVQFGMTFGGPEREAGGCGCGSGRACVEAAARCVFRRGRIELVPGLGCSSAAGDTNRLHADSAMHAIPGSPLGRAADPESMADEVSEAADTTLSADFDTSDTENVEPDIVHRPQLTGSLLPWDRNEFGVEISPNRVLTEVAW